MQVPSIRVFLWMTVALLTVTMLSCGRDEEPQVEKEEVNPEVVNDWESTDINGDATMSSRVMRFSVGSRSNATRGVTPFNGEDYTFSEGDRITIEMYRGSTKVGTKVYEVTDDETGELTYVGDEEDAFQWKSKSETVKLRAWSYGNSSDYTEDPVGSMFTLKTDQREATSGIDNYKELLYSPQQSYSYSANVALRLYHQLARLKITLTHEASGDLSVDYVKIGNSSIPTTATFSESGIDIANDDFIGTWTSHGTTNGQVYARADAANVNYSAVLFPNISLSGQLVNVTTTDGDTYAYTLPSSVSFNSGNQYSYTITLKDGFMKNPLWWMAQYDLATLTTFVSTHSTEAQPVFDFSDAAQANISGYHLPTLNEMLSIAPSNSLETSGLNVFDPGGTLASPSSFDEVACIIGGKNVPGSTSWWGKHDTGDSYAVRFIGTQYASAWHYKWIDGTGSAGLLIESYMISSTLSESQAKSLLADMPSSSIFKGTVGATTANQSPSNTTATTNFFVQRFIPAKGYLPSGTGNATNDKDTRFTCWTSDSYDDAYGWRFHGGPTFASVRTVNKSFGYPVRLFKNN